MRVDFGFMGVLIDPSAGSSRIPALSYAVYQVRYRLPCLTDLVAEHVRGDRKQRRLRPSLTSLRRPFSPSVPPPSAAVWAPSCALSTHLALTMQMLAAFVRRTRDGLD